MRQITARTPDGADIAVTIEGQGPALLLVTGLGGTARFWAPAAARLAATHTVISFDHRAVGASTRGSVTTSYPCTSFKQRLRGMRAFGAVR